MTSLSSGRSPSARPEATELWSPQQEQTAQELYQQWRQLMFNNIEEGSTYDNLLQRTKQFYHSLVDVTASQLFLLAIVNIMKSNEIDEDNSATNTIFRLGSVSLLQELRDRKQLRATASTILRIGSAEFVERQMQRRDYSLTDVLEGFIGNTSRASMSSRKISNNSDYRLLKRNLSLFFKHHRLDQMNVHPQLWQNTMYVYATTSADLQVLLCARGQSKDWEWSGHLGREWRTLLLRPAGAHENSLTDTLTLPCPTIHADYTWSIMVPAYQYDAQLRDMMNDVLMPDMVDYVLGQALPEPDDLRLLRSRMRNTDQHSELVGWLVSDRAARQPQDYWVKLNKLRTMAPYLYRSQSSRIHTLFLTTIDQLELQVKERGIDSSSLHRMLDQLPDSELLTMPIPSPALVSTTRQLGLMIERGHDGVMSPMLEGKWWKLTLPLLEQLLTRPEVSVSWAKWNTATHTPFDPQVRTNLFHVMRYHRHRLEGSPPLNVYEQFSDRTLDLVRLGRYYPLSPSVRQIFSLAPILVPRPSDSWLLYRAGWPVVQYEIMARAIEEQLQLDLSDLMGKDLASYMMAFT